MALTYQNVPISFAQGLDTKTDAKQVVPGKLLELENGVFYQSRSIKKRDGFEALPTERVGGGDVASGYGIETLGNLPVIFGDNGVYSYADSMNLWTNQTGRLKPLTLDVNEVASNGTSQVNPDSAYDEATGLACFVWAQNVTSGTSDFSSIQYSIIDTATGAKLISDASVYVTAPDRPTYFKVLAVDGYFYIIFQTPNNTNIVYKRVQAASSIVLEAPVLVAGDTAAGVESPFDATVFDGKIYLAYSSSTTVKLLTITGGTVSGATSVAGVTATRCVAIWGDTSNNAWAACSDGATVKFFVYDSALSSQVIAPTTVLAVAEVIKITGVYQPGTSPIKSTLYFERYIANPSANPTCTLFRYTITSAATVGGVVSSALGISSKVVIYDSFEYLLTAFRSTLQPTFFLGQTPVVDFAGGNYQLLSAASKIAPQTAYCFSSISGSSGRDGWVDVSACQELWQSSPGVFHVSYSDISDANTYLTPTSLSKGFPVAGVKRAAFDLTTAHVQSSVAANAVYAFGGNLSFYDGESLSEADFNMYPDASPSLANNGPGGITVGTRLWTYIYRWVDVNGQIHRSAPAPGASFTNAGGTVAVTLYNYRLSMKQTVFIDVYRTEASGTVFYLAGTVTNDLSTPTQVFNDSISDASIVGRTQLYTTGGEVENIAPPAPRTVGTYKNRVILVPVEDPAAFWYSKEIVPGYPAEFSDLFVQSIDQKGGGITAVAQLDDKLCLFKRDSIFVVTGDGPAPSGANNDFTPAQEIASDSGCIDPRSLVLTPDGIMYQSNKGIYLLGRNLQVSYIGADVEAYNNNVITSATMLSKRNQVIFTLDSGVALVYDYAFNQWAVFTGIDAVNTAIYGDKIAYVKSDGTVMLETPGVFLDDNVGYSLKLKTSWLSFAGLQGFQRVYSVLLLGEYKSSHTLRVECAHDFVDTIDQTIDIVASSTPPFQYGCDFKYQKAQAVQLTIQDVSPTGESLELSNMAFEVGVKQGSFRVGQERTNA